MALQLEHIFASEGVRARKVDGQAFVQGQLLIRVERPVMGETWFQLTLADGLSQLSGQWPGHTHDSHSATTLGSGDGGDGVSGVVHGIHSLCGG